MEHQEEMSLSRNERRNKGKAPKEKKPKKKKGFISWLFTLLPILLILGGLVFIGMPFLQDYFIEQEQNAIMDAMDHPDAASGDNSPIKIASNGDMYVDLDINNDEEVGYDEFIDPETGEAIGHEPLPELGAEVPGKLRVKILGRLYVPKIECYYSIVEGSGRTELKYSIGHWRSSVHMGEVGNAVFPGHRNYTYGKYFNRLDELAEGDIIKVYDMDNNEYVYEVDRVLIIDPKDLYTTLAVQEGEELMRRITLSTCHPVMVASHRLCVQGVLIEGPAWTKDAVTPLNPATADEKAMQAKLDELKAYEEMQQTAQ